MSLRNVMVFLSFSVMPKPREPTAGYSSRVPHSTKHVILLDYDHVRLSVVEDELRALQTDPEFRLGTFHILQSGEKSYGCICLDEVPFHELRQIQFHTTCDIAYKTAPRYDEHRACVLRFEEKGKRPRPTYLKSLLAPSTRKQHLGTAMLLNAYFGVPMELLENSDGNKSVIIEEYLTANRVK